MYNGFYQFKESPFNVTSDPEFFFSSARHAEAFSHLVYGITQRKGIIVLTGEIGTGKTTLCRILLNKLDKSIRTAFVFNPRFSDIQLLQLIVKDFGITGQFKNKFDIITALNEFLLQEASVGRNVVIIIDEAQNLSVKQLEQVRLLSNLETEKEKLLQIVLIGQPELDEKLKLPQLRQLNQRVSVRYHIPPLDPADLQRYIYHRLKIASLATQENMQVNFTEKAIDAVYQHSYGTPRMVNILCDRALLAGYAAETFTIDENIVNKCADEVL
jgi:general secretion pathway protein A